MPRLRRIFYSLVGGAICMAPLFACGHACEFLFARLDVQPDGVVQLEMTADFGANPLIPDEAAAHHALSDVLRIQNSGHTLKLGDLAPLHFQKSSQWDPGTPASFSPPSDGTVHQLLIATWQWRPDTDSVAFAVPKGSPNDVLLWTPIIKAADGTPKWMLLIEGETSMPIELTKKQTNHWVLISTALGGLVIIGVGILSISRSRHRH